MLADADILITGGTGSFGRALVKHLLDQNPSPRRIIVFSRDELKQHQMSRELEADDMGRMRFFLGDVRDAERLKTAFRGVDYVVHAAAMKQVPACEYNPTEAIRTNVDGAINVAAAAIDAGVKRVIALSTDKAVNPANLYGATKACAERLFTHANVMAGALDTRFSCVRYGNVLGSRGSVLQVWRAQLAAGRKLTITSPLMTRFWLTLPQGVAYVLSALERMAGAEIFVPKLPSCSMVELAEMVAPDGGWERIPVRRGEKMHEILISADEADRVQAWPAEFIIKSEPLGEDQWRVPEGFTYRSDTNSDRLTATELAKILEGVA